MQQITERLTETEQALIDIWKAFSPPKTAKECLQAMDKHKAVLNRIVKKRNSKLRRK